MNLAQTYFDNVQAQLRLMVDSQGDAIRQAGLWFAEALANDRWIYIFGSGHSHMLAEELFYRAGGLTRVVPMLFGPLMLHEGAVDSTRLERDLALAPVLLEHYPVGSGDVLVVVSNSGRNSVPIELALRARDSGARIIVVVNRQQSQQLPSRHPGGRNLHAVSDLVLDNCGAMGDACVPVEQLGLSVGPTSTVAATVLLQMVVCAAVEQALHRGVRLEIFSSSNTVGDEANRAILDKYRGRVPHLFARPPQGTRVS